MSAGPQHWCDLRKACSGTNTGHFNPVLVLPRWTGPDARQRLPIRVCWSCRTAASVYDLVPDSAWANIVQSYAATGKNPPERIHVGLEWVNAA